MTDVLYKTPRQTLETASASWSETHPPTEFSVLLMCAGIYHNGRILLIRSNAPNATTDSLWMVPHVGYRRSAGDAMGMNNTILGLVGLGLELQTGLVIADLDLVNPPYVTSRLDGETFREPEGTLIGGWSMYGVMMTWQTMAHVDQHPAIYPEWSLREAKWAT